MGTVGEEGAHDYYELMPHLALFLHSRPLPVAQINTTIKNKTRGSNRHRLDVSNGEGEKENRGSEKTTTDD